MAAEMATIVGDATGLQQRHHPLNIPPLVEKIEGFPLKAKSTYQKHRGEEFHQPPPPLPCTTVGVWLCVCVRGLKDQIRKQLMFKFLYINASPLFRTKRSLEMKESQCHENSRLVDELGRLKKRYAVQNWVFDVITWIVKIVFKVSSYHSSRPSHARHSS